MAAPWEKRAGRIGAIRDGVCALRRSWRKWRRWRKLGSIPTGSLADMSPLANDLGGHFHVSSPVQTPRRSGCRTLTSFVPLTSRRSGRTSRRSERTSKAPGTSRGLQIPPGMPAGGSGPDFHFMQDRKREMKSLHEPRSAKDSLKVLQGHILSNDEMDAVITRVCVDQRRFWQTHGKTAYETLGLPDDFFEFALVLYAYTIDDPPVFKKVSRFFNDETERSKPENKAKMEAVMRWFKYVHTAISMLPATPEFEFTGICYRGMKYRYPDLTKRFKRGSIIYWYLFKSIAVEKRVMENEAFCGMTGDGTIIIIEKCTVKLIKAFSDFPEEEEGLVPPFACFKVLGVTKGTCAYGDPFETADRIHLEMQPPEADTEMADRITLENQTPKARRHHFSKAQSIR